MPFDSYADLQLTVLDWLARPGDPLVAPAVPDMIAMFEEEARDRLQTRFVEQTTQLTPVPGQSHIPLPLDFASLREIWITTAYGRVAFQYQTPVNLDTNFRDYYYFNLDDYPYPYPYAFTIEGLNLRVISPAPTATTPAGSTGPTVTLTPGAASTIYSDVTITPTTFVGLMPDTENAADALPSLWVVPGTGSAVINHASSPNIDQTFVVTLFNSVPATQLPGVINIRYLSGIPPLGAATPTNWLLTQYPSVYLWGTLVCAAAYIGDDPRLQLWLGSREAAIERIRLADRRAKYPSGLMIQTDVRNP